MSKKFLFDVEKKYYEKDEKTPRREFSTLQQLPRDVYMSDEIVMFLTGLLKSTLKKNLLTTRRVCV